MWKKAEKLKSFYRWKLRGIHVHGMQGTCYTWWTLHWDGVSSLSVLSYVSLANVSCWVLFLSLSSLVLQTSILYFLEDNALWQKSQLEIPGTNRNAFLWSCAQVHPLSTLISSSQTCQYTLDPKRKHVSEAVCDEQHLFLPFSYK
jgi:hypothetical protein